MENEDAGGGGGGRRDVCVCVSLIVDMLVLMKSLFYRALPDKFLGKSAPGQFFLFYVTSDI